MVISVKNIYCFCLQRTLTLHAYCICKFTVRSADICFIITSPGAAMFAPMANPYDSKMTKDERRKTWDSWSTKRKLMHILARRFPSLLPFFYHQTFLSGKQGQPESWLSLSLGKKVC